MSYPKIVRAEAIGERVIRFEFANREIKDYDISYLIDKPMFLLLQKPAFFRNFKVEPGGYGLVWNDDIDISEYELWIKGKTVQINGDSTFSSALPSQVDAASPIRDHGAFLNSYAAEDEGLYEHITG